MNFGAQLGPMMTITELSPNWACQMGLIHCPKYFCSLGYEADRKLLISITDCHSLMYFVTFSKRSQPGPYVPLKLGRVTLSCLPKRTRILFRGHYTMLSAHRRSKLIVIRLQEGI